MDEGAYFRTKHRRTASTRVVVEAAVDFAKGANQITWEANRSKESSDISPWRTGGFFIDERFAQGSGETEDI